MVGREGGTDRRNKSAGAETVGGMGMEGAAGGRGRVRRPRDLSIFHSVSPLLRPRGSSPLSDQ